MSVETNPELFDGDGYPTEDALLQVARHDTLKDLDGFLALIQALWSYPDRFVLDGDTLYLSTGGWSGNESVISSMKQNFFFFIAHKEWKRGGHFWFDLKGYTVKTPYKIFNEGKKREVYTWLGFWRDKIPEEAVKQLQDILGKLKEHEPRKD
jgi:hypothetical protein